MRIAIVGAGWSGLAAAVSATRAGAEVTVLEATRQLGGRARTLAARQVDDTPVALDNGQHILVGAYVKTLHLMRSVGVVPEQVLLRMPLELRRPDGSGICFPDWPSPWDALWGILAVPQWDRRDKWSLLRATFDWQRSGFNCAADTSVAQLCRGLTPQVMDSLIEPLCVSALNTPAQRASAQVFLSVLRDTLFASKGGSQLLLPRVDLSALFPRAAALWLQAQGAQVRTGHRVQSLRRIATPAGQHPATTGRWALDGVPYDAVIWATSASAAVHGLSAVQDLPQSLAPGVHAWCKTASALAYEAITTVYAMARGVHLPRPMLALRDTDTRPAQFVFDRGQLCGQTGLLAFVVSASASGTERDAIEQLVLEQGQAELHQHLKNQILTAVQTVVEKRATFACTPGLKRPGQLVASGLFVCGDYVDGPYPATLEGAVRSGLCAAAAAIAAD